MRTSAQSMPVAILSGGLATRMRPLTEHIPKALIEVAGRPFVDWQLEFLASQGFQRVVLCTGHLGLMLRDHVGDGKSFGVTVIYSEDGERPLGTGGAIKKALPLLGPEFLVLYGDSFLPIDFRKVAEAFRECGKQALMTVFRNEGAWDTSNVEMDREDIICYSKTNRTPRMDHIDYGLSIYQAAVFEGFEAPFDLATLMEHLVARRLMAAHRVNSRFYEIGTPTGLSEMEGFLNGLRARS